MIIKVLKKGSNKFGFWYLCDISNEFVSYHILANSELDLKENATYDSLILRISSKKGIVRYDLVKKA